jgi:Zn-dependent protease
VLIPTRTTRKPKATPQTPSRWGNWPWIIAGLALLIAYLAFALPGTSTFTFFFVLVGWIFSVTLHEFGHALVAYIGGDTSVREKGYLTFNPLKYTHPMLSIIMPLIFLAMGGIGLPGGAVYIERHRLRSKWWGAAVSAAGPTANLLFALLLAMPFLTGLVNVDAILLKVYYDNRKDDWLINNPGQTETDFYHMVGIENPGSIWNNVELWSAVAFLAMLQVTALILNLIPIPPLDGFGIIEPFLDEGTRRTLLQIGFTGGIFLIFLLLWMVKPVEREFWDTVFQITHALHVPDWLGALGHDAFMFWRD